MDDAATHSSSRAERTAREKRIRLASHIGFWLAALAFYTVYFGQRQSTYGQSLVFVALLFPITIATTYFLLYWLIPRYLLARRYAFFALYFTYTIVFSVYLELMLVTVMYIVVSDFREMFITPSLVEFLNVLAGMYVVVFAAAAIHLVKRWNTVRAFNVELDRRRLEAELKLKEAELKLLKSQIHPHFLFNTLNNLYGLTLERSEQASDVVLRISSMLDYMLYRGRQARVPLEDEIEYIRNYLALESIRFGERIQVTMDIEGPVEHAGIAPLLLIPFVENAFKHGVGQSSGSGDIRIGLSLDDGTLEFAVRNTKPDHPSNRSETESEGIGLKNVQKRLALLYDGRHELTMDDGVDQYTIRLSLKLDERPEDTLPHR